MRYFIAIWIFVVVAVISLLGFRGDRFERPPIWVFPDMDIQARYSPQGKNVFFENGMDDRPVVPGTVGRGYAWDRQEVFSGDYRWPVAENPYLYSGRDDDGKWLREFPIPVSAELMELGRQKYDIFCLVCHGKVGDGNGVTKRYGMVATPTFHDERLRTMANGEIFDTITHGKNLMGAYGAVLEPKERWAVIAYMRALQLAANATPDDVPPAKKRELGL